MQLWGSVFMLGLVLLVGGGIKLVSKIGLVAFGVALLTFIGFYVSLLGAPHLTAVDGVYLDDGSSGSSGSDGSDGSDGGDGEGGARALLEGARRLASEEGFPRPSGVGNIAHNLRENWGPHWSDKYGFSECLSVSLRVRVAGLELGESRLGLG